MPLAERKPSGASCPSRWQTMPSARSFAGKLTSSITSWPEPRLICGGSGGCRSPLIRQSNHHSGETSLRREARPPCAFLSALSNEIARNPDATDELIWIKKTKNGSLCERPEYRESASRSSIARQSQAI
jgi:hypothetical protein